MHCFGALWVSFLLFPRLYTSFQRNVYTSGILITHFIVQLLFTFHFYHPYTNSL